MGTMQQRLCFQFGSSDPSIFTPIYSQTYRSIYCCSLAQTLWSANSALAGWGWAPGGQSRESFATNGKRIVCGLLNLEPRATRRHTALARRRPAEHLSCDYLNDRCLPAVFQSQSLQSCVPADLCPSYDTNLIQVRSTCVRCVQTAAATNFRMCSALLLLHLRLFLLLLLLLRVALLRDTTGGRQRLLKLPTHSGLPQGEQPITNVVSAQ